MIDIKKIKPGKKVKLLDGKTHDVRGCYMSENGIVITVKTRPGSVVDRNVHIEDIQTIED